MHKLKSKLKLLFHHFISHHAPQPICHCHRQPWMTALQLQQATKKYQKNYAHESKQIDPALTTKTSITLQAHPWTDFSSRSKRKLHDMCQQSLKNIQKKVQYFRYLYLHHFCHLSNAKIKVFEIFLNRKQIQRVQVLEKQMYRKCMFTYFLELTVQRKILLQQ